MGKLNSGQDIFNFKTNLEVSDFIGLPFTCYWITFITHMTRILLWADDQREWRALDVTRGDLLTRLAFVKTKHMVELSECYNNN